MSSASLAAAPSQGTALQALPAAPPVPAMLASWALDTTAVAAGLPSWRYWQRRKGHEAAQLSAAAQPAAALPRMSHREETPLTLGLQEGLKDLWLSRAALAVLWCAAPRQAHGTHLGTPTLHSLPHQALLLHPFPYPVQGAWHQLTLPPPVQCSMSHRTSCSQSRCADCLLGEVGAEAEVSCWVPGASSHACSPCTPSREGKVPAWH